MISTPSIVSKHIVALTQMCRRHHVARLELFGSGASGKFDASRSDLDFLIEFEPLQPKDRANAYFGILEELQDLFQRDIDLVEAESIANPFFKRTVDADRTVLYVA